MMTRPVTLAIHALLFIAPLFLLLILVFWDRQRIPLSKIILGISCFLPVSIIGTFFYRLWENSTVLQSMLSLLSILIGIVIFSSLMNYTFSQSVFIIIVSKCYIDNTRLLSHYIYFLFTGTMPEISPPCPDNPLYSRRYMHVSAYVPALPEINEARPGVFYVSSDMAIIMDYPAA